MASEVVRTTLQSVSGAGHRRPASLPPLKRLDARVLNRSPFSSEDGRSPPSRASVTSVRSRTSPAARPNERTNTEGPTDLTGRPDSSTCA